MFPGGGGGSVELDISYSQTQPGEPKALWIKGNPPTTKTILSPMLSYGNVTVENTGATNPYNYRFLGGGFYHDVYYFIQAVQTKSSSSQNVYKMSLYSFDPVTLTITPMLADFISETQPQNSTTKAKAAVRGNKLFLAATGFSLGGSSSTLVVIDLDTQIFTTYRPSIPPFIYNYATTFTPAAAENKFWRAGGDETFYCVDYALNLSTSYSVGAGSYGYLLDDGYHLYMLPYTGTTASVFDYNAGTISNTTCPANPNALFQMGNKIYIGAGTSIYEWAYDGSTSSFNLVTGESVAWGRNSFSSNSDYGYGGDCLWTNGPGYAANGNVLYCIATSRRSSGAAEIMRLTFENANYPAGSVIISTTPRQKNRAKLVAGEEMDLDVFVDAVYSVSETGEVTRMEAYTQDSTGQWIEV